MRNRGGRIAPLPEPCPKFGRFRYRRRIDRSPYQASHKQDENCDPGPDMDGKADLTGFALRQVTTKNAMCPSKNDKDDRQPVQGLRNSAIVLV